MSLSMQGLSVDLEPMQGDEVVVAGVDEDPETVSLAFTHVHLLLLQLVVCKVQLCNTVRRRSMSFWLFPFSPSTARS